MAPALSTSPDKYHPSPNPFTSTPAPSAARIRENQRRSRARRKEYLHELEQKLRKCEQAGVKASVDIQRAARGVAEENKKLREENGRLREEGKKLREDNERMRALLEGRKQQNRAEDTSGRGYVAGASSLGLEVEVVEPSASASQLQETTGCHAGEPTAAVAECEKIYTQPVTPTPAEVPPEVPYVGQNDEMVLGDDTSSCEYAAHIITSMRADISTDDVRADLGCGGDVREWRKCKVDNSKLFVAMDRYTG